jgi:hypothetical protein
VFKRGSLGENSQTGYLSKSFMSYQTQSERDDSVADILPIISASTCHIEIDWRKVAQWVKPNNDSNITVSGLDKYLHYTVTNYGEVPGYGKI